MPELPDITVYVERLRAMAQGHVLKGVRLLSPFLLRSVTPRLPDLAGARITGFSRIGKRIVWELEGDRFLVLHLMVSGRLRWRPVGAVPNKKLGLAAFDLDNATVVLTEASSHKRASLYAVQGREGLAEHDPGGLDVMTCSWAEFGARLRSERHTLKRALTDPRLFDGIGNAYSDEILHRAKMSPVQWTTNLFDAEVAKLHECCQLTLREWTDRLRLEVGERFPEEVTAFRPEMAVHGKYDQPCPVCGSPVQRIVYAENETNYCATCQTQGTLLRDRALSQLLKGDWPKTLDELEKRMGRG